MQRLLLLGLAAFLALGGSAAAHYNGSDQWHDFGSTLGAFGASPAGQAVGACWYTDSTFLDASDPGGLQPGELFGHQGGLGVEYDGDCDQSGNPDIYGRVTAPEQGEIAFGLQAGAEAPALP